MKYCSIYEVTRHYGGSEEGGWWYDWYDAVATFVVPKAYHKKRNWRKKQAFVSSLLERFMDRKWGDISSVNGGRDVKAYFENHPRLLQSTTVPHYE